MGTQSRLDQYKENFIKIQLKNLENDTNGDFDSSKFPSILPIPKRIFAQTMGIDLVPVLPMNGGNSPEELDKIKRDILSENRDRKIETINDGKEYKEMKPEEHPNFKEITDPVGKLLYLDYTYGSTSSDSI